MEIARTGWLDRLKTQGFVAVTFKTLASWAFSNASKGLTVSTGCCCSHQMQSGLDSSFNPHHADVLIVSGALSVKAAFVVRRLYDQMPSPKYVMAFGNCAINGGVFASSYAITTAADILPVDINVPGCPPDREKIMQAVEKLRDLIRCRIWEG